MVLHNSLFVLLSMMQQDKDGKFVNITKELDDKLFAKDSFVLQERVLATSLVVLGIVFCVTSIVCCYGGKVRKGYQQILSFRGYSSKRTLAYLFQKGNHVDPDVQDVDGTFVGVSVPILQDVSNV